MNRAIVMSLEGNRAVVLAQGGRFVQVPSQPHYRVGDEIELEPEEARPRRLAFATIARGRARAAAAAIASCAAVLMLLAGVWWFRAPSVVAYVTMDVNPSVEFGIDGKERVRELRALNRDADPIVAFVKYKGENIEEVTEEIARELAERHLLNGGDSEVVLASVAIRKVDERWEAEVTDKMKRAIEEAGAIPDEGSPEAGPKAGAGTDKGTGAKVPGKTVPQITTVSVPKEVREEAKANGVSAGKMAFWLKAESQGHDVPIEALKHRSMKKIASSWGGVQEVLGSGTDGAAEQDEDWSKLLQEARKKQKEKEQEKQKEKQKESKREKENKKEKDNDNGTEKAGQKPPGKGGGNGVRNGGKDPDDSSKENGKRGKDNKNGDKGPNNGSSGKDNKSNVEDNGKGKNGNGKNGNGNNSDSGNNGKNSDNGKNGKNGDKDKNGNDEKNSNKGKDGNKSNNGKGNKGKNGDNSNIGNNGNNGNVKAGGGSSGGAVVVGLEGEDPRGAGRDDDNRSGGERDGGQADKPRSSGDGNNGSDRQAGRNSGRGNDEDRR